MPVIPLIPFVMAAPGDQGTFGKQEASLYTVVTRYVLSFLTELQHRLGLGLIHHSGLAWRHLRLCWFAHVHVPQTVLGSL